MFSKIWFLQLVSGHKKFVQHQHYYNNDGDTRLIFINKLVSNHFKSSNVHSMGYKWNFILASGHKNMSNGGLVGEP